MKLIKLTEPPKGKYEYDYKSKVKYNDMGGITVIGFYIGNQYYEEYEYHDGTVAYYKLIK